MSRFLIDASSFVPVFLFGLPSFSPVKNNEKTRLGLSLPLIYRVGSYSSPDGYTINNESEINYGIMGTAGMQLPLFELQTKLGHLNKSNLLMINLLYTF